MPWAALIAILSRRRPTGSDERAYEFPKYDFYVLGTITCDS